MLSWANLSFVVPATAIVYVVTVLGAKFFLEEQIDGLRWAGTVLICFGVALICLPEGQVLSLSMIIEPVRVVLGILTAASVCYYIASVIAAEKFFRHRDGGKGTDAGTRGNPVSILIPLRGVDIRAYQNYASLCRQNYPEFEIIFGVSDPQDSSLQVISRPAGGLPPNPHQACYKLR